MYNVTICQICKSMLFLVWYMYIENLVRKIICQSRRDQNTRKRWGSKTSRYNISEIISVHSSFREMNKISGEAGIQLAFLARLFSKKTSWYCHSFVIVGSVCVLVTVQKL